MIRINKNNFEEEFNVTNKFSNQSLLKPTGTPNPLFPKKVLPLKEPDFFFHNFIKLHPIQDGSIYLIAEQIFAGPGDYYPDDFEDILVTKLSKTGEILWYKVIPKKQTISKDSNGHISAILNNELILIYFTNKDNLNKKKGRNITRDSVVPRVKIILTKIDEEGKMIQKILVNDKETSLNGLEHYIINKKELLIFTNTKKALKLSKIFK